MAYCIVSACSCSAPICIHSGPSACLPPALPLHPSRMQSPTLHPIPVAAEEVPAIPAISDPSLIYALPHSADMVQGTLRWRNLPVFASTTWRMPSAEPCLLFALSSHTGSRASSRVGHRGSDLPIAGIMVARAVEEARASGRPSERSGSGCGEVKGREMWRDIRVANSKWG